MPDSDRVRILLNTLNFQAHIVVDRALVNKVSPTTIGGNARASTIPIEKIRSLTRR
jgi:hypothetical protein